MGLKKGLHRWRPNNSVVGDEGCPRAADAARFRFGPTALACCAGKRFAFSQLRTLAGSNPMRWAQTKTVPLRGPFPIRWWAMRDARVRLAPPAPRFVAPLLACCAGKRFAFPQLRTLSGSNPSALDPKTKGLHRWRPNNSVVGDEGFEPPALCV